MFEILNIKLTFGPQMTKLASGGAALRLNQRRHFHFLTKKKKNHAHFDHAPAGAQRALPTNQPHLVRKIFSYSIHNIEFLDICMEH